MGIWGAIKKAVNSDLTKPLNTLFNERLPASRAGYIDEIVADTRELVGDVNSVLSHTSEIVVDTRELVTDVNAVLVDTAALDSRLTAARATKIDTISSRLDLVKPSGSVLYTSPATITTADTYNYCYGGRYFVNKTGYYKIKVTSIAGGVGVYSVGIDDKNALSLPINTVLQGQISVNDNYYKYLADAQNGVVGNKIAFLLAGQAVMVISSSTSMGYFDIAGEVV